MNQKLAVELFKTFAENWLRGLGLKQLRKYAQDPKADLHVSWHLIGISFYAWLVEAGQPAPWIPKGAKQLVKITTDGVVFWVWYSKTA